MSAHLGNKISALADGQLSASAREKALCHVASCQYCAQELQAERQARNLVRQAVKHSETLSDRENDAAIERIIQAYTPVAERLAGQLRTVKTLHSVGQLPARDAALCGDLSRSQLLAARVIVLCLLIPALGLGLALLAWLGGTETSGLALKIAHLDGDVESYVAQGATPIQLGNQQVYLLSQTPAHLVWQQKDEVIDLQSQAGVAETIDFVANSSQSDFDDSFTARIKRGWTKVVGD